MVRIAVSLFIAHIIILSLILTSRAVAFNQVAMIYVTKITAPLPGYGLKDGPPVTKAILMIGLKSSLVCKKVPLIIALAVTGFHLVEEWLLEEVVTING